MEFYSMELGYSAQLIYANQAPNQASPITPRPGPYSSIFYPCIYPSTF